MLKVIEAVCEAGIVEIEGMPIEDATILSEGVKSSEGVALMEEERVTYLTSNASDIQDVITKLNQVVTKLVTMFTNVDVQIPLANGTGGTATAANTVTIPQLTTLNTELQAIKENLK